MIGSSLGIGHGLLASVLCGCLLGWHTPVQGAPTAEERATARAADAALKKAASLVRAKKYSDAAEPFEDAQRSLDKLTENDSRDVNALAAPLQKQSDKLRGQLEAQGVKVAAGKSAPRSKDGGVSFTKQIAPILVARCGNCHVQRSRGELSMATYAALARGSKSGTVIMVGDAKGSRLIELIESGDMPRGGKVSAEELALLTAWINAGARFDGVDSAAPLTSFVDAKPAKTPDASQKLKVVAAGTDDKVQFARDVAPILLANCLECHGQQNPRKNLSMSTFDRLLRGGDDGPVLVPGKGAESLLVKKLRGTAGDRMPQGRPPLSEENIAAIEQWIALGARFDGSDSGLGLEETIAQAFAVRATHEELMQRRVELAASNWRLILPDAKSRHEETADVLVWGGVGPDLLAGAARTAADEVERLRKLFKLPAGEPLVKGRVTLFVFEKRYDYGEVGAMLEHRELPTVWRGHWHFDPLDAYACVLLNSAGQAPGSIVAQQLAGVYVASLGKVPHWFAEGTARAVAARVDPKDPRVKLWDDQVGRILNASDKPEAFLTGGLALEENDILSYSFVKFLMSAGGRHAALLASLRQGTPFDDAFIQHFNVPPVQAVRPWLAKIAKRGR
jgi:mono/diheme cytochrome c family protein